MSHFLTAEEIRALGFDWPGVAAAGEAAVVYDGFIDLDATLAHLRESHAFVRKQISAAYAFKQSSGADYSDFTNRLDDYVRRRDELKKAIAAVERILAALNS